MEQFVILGTKSALRNFIDSHENRKRYTLGLLLLVALGAVLGWLVSIMSQPTDGATDWALIASGVLSATLAGLLVHDGSALTGLSPRALMAAILACTTVLSVMVLFCEPTDNSHNSRGPR